MSFGTSPGVYAREKDQSFVVPAVANSIGGIVISSDKGPSNEVTLVTDNQQFIEMFGEPTPDNPSKYSALAFLEQGSRLLVARAIVDAQAATANIMNSADTNTILTVDAANEGAWGNNITVSSTAPVNGIFTITVKFNGIEVETFRVSRDTAAKDGFGRTLYVEDVVNEQSSYIRITDDPSQTDAPADTTDLALSGGSNDTTPITDTEINTALDLFATREEVDVNLLINAGFATATVQQKMISVCETRGDTFAVLDIPEATVEAQDIADYTNTTLTDDTSFAAIYAPWVKIYDQWNDKYVWVPPSGFVAGTFAYTAEVAEVWYAPAGARRGSIRVLETKNVFSEGERDTIYAASVNPIQSFTGEGIVVFGQKTLQRNPSALDRVNVRMLMITIQKAMSRSLRPFMFEFNDSFTRENIASILNDYLEDIQARRGLYDFLVQCNSKNNTPQVIDQNKLIVDVYVKPVRVAEYIRLNAIITATGADFSTTT